MDKVAILIVNYNMPERTDALVEHIQTYVEWPYELFVIDNGSDLVPESVYSNVHLAVNVQTTRGWLEGLDVAREIATNAPHLFTEILPDGKTPRAWLGYWFLITSTEFVENRDVLTPMAELLVEDDNAVGVHPALTEDSTSDWPHLFDLGTGRPRWTWHIDNIASLWRADWFEEVGGFDERLTMAWGIDLELSWKARRSRRGLYVHEGVRVRKETDIGYRMKRMNQTADERRQQAGAEMARVLSDKYGPEWWPRMIGEYVEEGMLMGAADRGMVL